MPNNRDRKPSPRTRRGIYLTSIVKALLCALLIARLASPVFASPSKNTHQRSAQLPPSAVDSRGKHIRLNKPPNRIVSLIPATTEILFALGLQPQIVGDTAYCDYPPAARNLPHVGDMNISVEKVLALRPNLVICSASGNPKAIAPLERARIPVFTVDPKNLAQTRDAIKAIGQITGRAAQADSIVRTMQAREATIRQAVSRDPAKPKVLVILQTDPLWIVGSGNFVDELVNISGGVNIAADSGQGFHTWSPELVTARRPDIILANPESLSKVLSRPSWRNVPAVRLHKVYALDPAKFTRPGPRLADALNDVARLLHPKSFGGK